ncbi:MAG TPA: hypothetical protein VK971_09725 [Thiohalobacter sp.]|nr:hypothetical protein [Thiohalobacter sp.]
MKIGLAALLGVMVWRLWPAANHWLKHGPRGSGQDWQAALLPILAVVAFIVLLILMVRG